MTVTPEMRGKANAFVRQYGLVNLGRGRFALMLNHLGIYRITAVKGGAYSLSVEYHHDRGPKPFGKIERREGEGQTDRFLRAVLAIIEHVDAATARVLGAIEEGPQDES
jgi:hypothetical protein